MGNAGSIRERVSGLGLHKWAFEGPLTIGERVPLGFLSDRSDPDDEVNGHLDLCSLIFKSLRLI